MLKINTTLRTYNIYVLIRVVYGTRMKESRELFGLINKLEYQSFEKVGDIFFEL